MARRGQRRRAPTAAGGFNQLPFQQYRIPFAPLALISDDELEAIHQASLTILARHGIRFLLPEALEVWREAGAEIGEDQLVRMDPDLIMTAMAQAPATFSMFGRNPARTLEFGGNTINFAAVSSPPNATDLDRGRRQGTYQDFTDFLRLTQMVNVAQFVSGHPVEPTDVPTPVRHLHATRAMLTLTDKAVRIYALSRERTLDAIAMLKIAGEVDDAGLRARPSACVMINSNSPRQYDTGMLWGMIECARAGLPVLITPFTLAGAMAPVSLAGALALQNAEALAGLAFCQLVKPGCPVGYGGFTSNVDMKSGAPAFGTPEYVKATLIGGQLARRYRVPYRGSNVNASNAPDAQSVYESQMALWACVLGHCNYVHHGLGWLEGGLAASFEKFIIDAEMVQGLVEVLKPVKIDAAELALEAIGEVAPGGHFFGTAHTLERYETAFYTPLLSDWRNFEAWTEAGSVDATHRASAIYKALLAAYEAPPIDPGVSAALDDFVARREREGGAPLQ